MEKLFRWAHYECLAPSTVNTLVSGAQLYRLIPLKIQSILYASGQTEGRKGAFISKHFPRGTRCLKNPLNQWEPRGETYMPRPF